MEALSNVLVAGLLAAQFPSLKVQSIAFIGEGEGRTYLVNGAYVFRFPRDDHGAEKMRQELCLLSAIGRHLPIAVPDLEFVGQPSEWYPYMFAGHRRIVGRSGEEARPERSYWPAIARQLGEFFSDLHAVPVATGERCDLQYEPMVEPASLLRNTLKYAGVIRNERATLVNQHVERYLRGDAALPPPSRPDMFVCHGDMKGEHIIMSERADVIVGIIDWTDCCLSDRILDFTGLVIWLGEAFLRQVLEHYTVAVDGPFLERVCFYARCFTLGHLGQRLSGKSDDPLELLLSQARWAFDT